MHHYTAYSIRQLKQCSHCRLNTEAHWQWTVSQL